MISRCHLPTVQTPSIFETIRSLGPPTTLTSSVHPASAVRAHATEGAEMESGGLPRKSAVTLVMLVTSTSERSSPEARIEALASSNAIARMSLNGEAERPRVDPSSAKRARGAARPDSHGPLQRLLGGTSTPLPGQRPRISFNQFHSGKTE